MLHWNLFELFLQRQNDKKKTQMGLCVKTIKIKRHDVKSLCPLQSHKCPSWCGQTEFWGLGLWQISDAHAYPLWHLGVYISNSSDMSHHTGEAQFPGCLGLKWEEESPWTFFKLLFWKWTSSSCFKGWSAVTFILITVTVISHIISWLP